MAYMINSNKQIPSITLTEEDVRSAIEDLKITGIDSIDDNGVMKLKTETDFCTCVGSTRECFIKHYAKVANQSLTYFLKRIYEKNPNIKPDFFCVKCDATDLMVMMIEKYKTVGELIPHLDNSDQSIIDKLKELPAETPSEAWMCSEKDWDNGFAPCFIDAADDCMAWAMTLPPVMTAQTFADIIRKNFIGIGKIIEQNEKTVYFFSDRFINNEGGYDYSHCVSHEIEPELLKSYFYHEKTVGEYLARQYKLLDNPEATSQTEFQRKSEIEELITQFEPRRITAVRRENRPEDAELIAELIKGQCARTDPFPLETNYEGTVKYLERELNKHLLLKKKWELRNDCEYNDTNYILKYARQLTGARTNAQKNIPLTELHRGFVYVEGVPLEMQIEACAIVAGVTVSEMKLKLE